MSRPITVKQVTGISRAANDERDDSPAALLKNETSVAPTQTQRRDASSRPSRPSPRTPLLDRFKLKEDYRARLHPIISRFTGYRPPNASPPYPPLIPLFSRISLKLEVIITATFASFVGILLVQSIAATHTVFRDTYNSPLIVASFGATAVLIFGAIESPLSQPRNVILGQLFSSILGVAITRLFARDPSYIPALDNKAFHYGTFINGPLSMAVALLGMFITGTLHPPGGATALIAATTREAAEMSWDYIPFVLVSTLLMFGWAMIVNNLGRRRYPIYWWSPQRTFVVENAPSMREDEEIALGTEREEVLRRAEDGGRTAEALREERLEGEGGGEDDIERALSRASRASRDSAYDRGRQHKRIS